MDYNEERERQQRRQQQAARRRNKEMRWNTANRATVTHPKYGSIVVPHRSNLAAIECAAEKWGCMPWDIAKDATVMWHPPERKE